MKYPKNRKDTGCPRCRDFCFGVSISISICICICVCFLLSFTGCGSALSAETGTGSGTIGNAESKNADRRHITDGNDRANVGYENEYGNGTVIGNGNAGSNNVGGANGNNNSFSGNSGGNTANRGSYNGYPNTELAENSPNGTSNVNGSDTGDKMETNAENRSAAERNGMEIIEETDADGSVVGIVIAILIAVAVIVLIVALIPKGTGSM